MEREEKLLTEGPGVRKKKVLVFGIDGGTFDLLLPWMERGLLPNLKKIKEEGVSGILKSSFPPVTTPAWNCFMTGKNPGKHGIYFFLARKPHSYEEMPINFNDMDGQTLWGILSDQGYKVGVLNVPLTYPPQRVNGVVISGFLTPSGKKDFIYPPQLVNEIEREFGKYYLHARSLDIDTYFSDKNIPYFLQDCRSMMLYKFRVAKYLIETMDFDFFMLHIWSADRIQHWLWNILDKKHPHYRLDISEKYYDEIVSLYRELDREMGEVIDKCDSSANVFVISDHGFCKVSKSIDLNVWLMKEGYIELKSGFPTRLRVLLWKRGFTIEKLYRRWVRRISKLGVRLKQKFIMSPGDFLNHIFFSKKWWLLSLGDVDWSKTKAYCKPSMGGQIFINLKGREPEGIVNPGQDYEILRNEIIQKLRDFMNEATGNKSEVEIYAKEEIYHGEYLGEMPDITFLAHNNGYLAGNVMGFASNRPIVDFAIHHGHHNMDGILLAKGKSIKDGITIDGTNIMDITPTILHIMGCKIPEDMDGEVRKEIFKEAFLEQNPVEFVEPRKEKRKQRSEMSSQEQKEIMERLRNLGYIE
jgi:predicted AlkP superfamily phosphohydrolase/phosphomutase